MSRRHPGFEAVERLTKVASEAVERRDCKAAFDAFLAGRRLIGAHADPDRAIEARLQLSLPEMAWSARCIELGYDRYRPPGGGGPEAKGDVTEHAMRRLRQSGLVEF